MTPEQQIREILEPHVDALVATHKCLCSLRVELSKFHGPAKPAFEFQCYVAKNFGYSAKAGTIAEAVGLTDQVYGLKEDIKVLEESLAAKRAKLASL